uniref:cytochrome-c oxidase n=1 Tax=Pylaiella littoralis TaxID=2885 RepID=Q94YZ5_PYLLI|nr:cytochrome c oxidase subunit 2 [Pylaiella littoralis]CAC50852.1 cytochrome c oxidase subunit 2 [Pylaiella littoralis]
MRIMNNIFKNISKIIPRLLLLFFVQFHTVAYMDASHPWQTGFQDPATPIMEGIIFFNGLLMGFMIIISCLVGWLLYKSLSLFNESVHATPVGFTHSTLLEVVWTIIPAVILMIISVPSYNLLYAMDEVIDPSLTIKVVGHQWYWSYECSDFEVSPKDQQESIKLVEEGQAALKRWLSCIEDDSITRGSSNKQPQTALTQELLDYLDNNLKEFSKEDSEIITNRLNTISSLLSKDESYNAVDALSAVKYPLEKGSLIPEQVDLVIKILNSFNKYLNLTGNIQSEFTSKDFIEAFFFLSLLNDLEALPVDFNSDSLPDFKGSGKGFDDDNDSSDDDGSVISELMYFDKSDPYWEWCELVSAEKESDKDYFALKLALSNFFTSERRCNNAALLEPEPEDENRPFLELVEDFIKDLRKFKKAKPIADLSESKLIDTQLIVHQLRLTRPEREIYSSYFALDRAVTEVNFAEVDVNIALIELENAKFNSHWCEIELAAANVNKLTAEYLQADASSAVTDPRLLRSAWINKKGYYSWHKFLKLVAKNLSEVERMAFLRADEELSGANSLLGKAQINLTLEELERSNAIADNAKAKFLAMEREVIPAMEEFNRGKFIVAEAKKELENFEELADRGQIRLAKAQASFDKVKPTLDRAKAKLKAADTIYHRAKARLVGAGPMIESAEGTLEAAENNFKSVKEKYNKATLAVLNANSDLVVCKERLKTVNANLIKTEQAFEDTGLLRTYTPKEGSPVEYYPNYLWEMRKEDLAFVKTQLKTDTARLESVYTSLNEAERQLNHISCELLESELIKGQILINSPGHYDIDAEMLKKTDNYLSGVKLEIAEATYLKALTCFELDNSDNSKLVLKRAEKALTSARLKDTNGYSGLIFTRDMEFIKSKDLIDSYAESCLSATKAELDGAEVDYSRATDILSKGESLLKAVSVDLAKDYNNSCLDTLRVLHKKTVLSLTQRIEQVILMRLELSPLDIKLEPGLLQSKSYQEVLLAKAELANIKWLCARVAKTLDIPLYDEAKPFNVQFSYLKTESPTSDSSNSNLEDGDSTSDGNSGDKKKPKTEDEIKEILSKVSVIKTPDNLEELKTEIIHTFGHLLKTMDKEQADRLLLVFDESFNSMVKEEVDKTQELKSQINLIKGNIDTCNTQEVDVERINFDSYLIADEDLVIPEASGTGKAGKVFRLLEVDNRLFVPTNTHIRLLVTSADVLHSWAVPSLGVKVDACPGRLNQVFIFVKREGVFYGQCSELCGVNHGFMPIVVQAVSQDDYLTWVGKRLCS